MHSQLIRLFGQMTQEETLEVFNYIWDTYLTDEQKTEFLKARNLIDKSEAA